jgi:hypothetical protein
LSSCFWLNTELPITSNCLTVIFSDTDSGTKLGVGDADDGGSSNCSEGGRSSGFGVWAGEFDWVGGTISCGNGVGN